MDIDNSTGGTGNGGIDIEQSLLQQFSCMGTTDREELIKELQNVVGSNISYAAAAFFLDMNNWNLQAAICSYFDVENPSKLPSMSVLNDPVATEFENIEPNTTFQKTWHLYNNGSEPWPVGCYLQCAGGDRLGGEPMQVPVLQPGEGRNVTLEMKSPGVPGIYQSKWRLCTASGSYFGDPMWAIVTVVEQGTMDLTQRLSHFSELGNIVQPVNSSVQNPFDYHVRSRTSSGQQVNYINK